MKRLPGALLANPEQELWFILGREEIFVSIQVKDYEHLSG